jgi:hypothetical protein
MFQTDYSGQTERLINARREKLAGASGMGKSDVAEMTIAANAAGRGDCEYDTRCCLAWRCHWRI